MMGGPLGSALAKARLDVEGRDKGAKPLWAGAQEARPDAAAVEQQSPAMLPTTGLWPGRTARQT